MLASWGGCQHFGAPPGFLEEQTGDDIVDLDEIGAQLSTPFIPLQLSFGLPYGNCFAVGNAASAVDTT